MRSALALALVLALAVSTASWAGAAPADPAQVWAPMHRFIGTWKGTRAGAEGPAKVTRVLSSSATNHHLEIMEKGGGLPRAAVRGMVSLDAERQVLVLRQFATDGSATEAALDPAASTGDKLVFASPESEAARLRITFERTGARSYLERIERSEGGGTFEVVSETRFVRAD